MCTDPLSPKGVLPLNVTSIHPVRCPESERRKWPPPAAVMPLLTSHPVACTSTSVPVDFTTAMEEHLYPANPLAHSFLDNCSGLTQLLYVWGVGFIAPAIWGGSPLYFPVIVVCQRPVFRFSGVSCALAAFAASVVGFPDCDCANSAVAAKPRAAKQNIHPTVVFLIGSSSKVQFRLRFNSGPRDYGVSPIQMRAAIAAARSFVCLI